jgi:predicted phage terminase large subunit-like protein
MLDKSRLKIWEKSRRIGASWIEACASVLAAVDGRGQNTIYISYNLSMTDQFIRDCEQWATAFNLALAGQGRKEIVDEANDILGYQIRMKNGRTIKALSSKPRNMRSKQARVVIDEAAFCDNLPALLKAAKALMIWGGSLSVLSTHDGVDNPYNEICEAIKAGEPEGEGWSLHTTDINLAVEEGLYKRVCLSLRQEWTIEKQKQWLERLFLEYGLDADEELLCIPFSGKAGKVFDVEKIVVVDDIPANGATVRFWDLAATEKDLTGANKNDPCYTAGVKMRIHGGKVWMLDVVAVQQSAGDVDKLMKATAIADGPACMVRWELEGGSAGKRDAAHITTNLMGFDAAPIRPQGDKVKRSIPLASQMAAGNVMMMRGTWNKQYKKWLHVFPDGKVKDPIDASSGAFAALTGTPDRINQQPAAWSGWGG